jgi:hypothetical protein
MEAFTRFFLNYRNSDPEEIFVFGTLGSAVVIIFAAIRFSREVLNKHIPAKAEAE